MIETLLGGLLGGAFRLAPEILKWLDRKGERGHELAMQDKALEFEKLRGAQRMAEIGAAADAAWNTGAIEALRESVAAQGRPSGVKWADALSTTVRPVVTYLFVLMYAGVKLSTFVGSALAGSGFGPALLAAWTEADQALLAVHPELLVSEQDSGKGSRRAVMARTGSPETSLRWRFLTKFDFAPDSGCWVWTGARHPQGYGLIKRKDGVQLRAHRLAYELAHGPIPDGIQVCHRCDNPSCVRPGHLFIGTARDNAADMVAKGRSARLTGERNGAARLNRQCVEDIRADDRPYRDLARRFGVSPSA